MMLTIQKSHWNGFDGCVDIEFTHSGLTGTFEGSIDYETLERWAISTDKFKLVPVRMHSEGDEMYENEDDLKTNHKHFLKWADDAGDDDLEDYLNDFDFFKK